MFTTLVTLTIPRQYLGTQHAYTHKFNKRGITRVLCMSCATCDYSTITHSAHSAHSALARTTKKMVAAKFVWPGLQKQVGIWAKACLRCQAATVHRHTTAPLDQFTPATRCFDHIHVDIVGPIPPLQNYRYLLTVVDRFTRWPEAIPLVDAHTITCAKAFAFQCIARFGVPVDLTSDRGSQFTSELWAILSQLHGTRLHRTTAYHPQSNGIVERFHRHLKSALIARLNGPNLDCSSTEMVYGAPLTVPGDFLPRGQETQEAAQFLPRLRETVRGLAPRPPVPLPVPDRRQCQVHLQTVLTCSNSSSAVIVTARFSHHHTRVLTRF